MKSYVNNKTFQLQAMINTKSFTRQILVNCLRIRYTHYPDGNEQLILMYCFNKQCSGMIIAALVFQFRLLRKSLLTLLNLISLPYCFLFSREFPLTFFFAKSQNLRLEKYASSIFAKLCARENTFAPGF